MFRCFHLAAVRRCLPLMLDAADFSLRDYPLLFCRIVFRRMAAADASFSIFVERRHADARQFSPRLCRFQRRCPLKSAPPLSLMR